MELKLDRFNGVLIDPDSIPDEKEVFLAELAEVLDFVHKADKKIIWLTLPIFKSHLISIATESGFVFHNCLENELTLIRKPACSGFVPFAPTHTIGAGAFILNDKDEILAVKEKGNNYFKLPGGHTELGESIEKAVVREVFEETGIESTFESIIAIATKHPYQFGKSNVYFVCRMKALNENICIHDSCEIEEALWILRKDFIADERNSIFNRQMVELLSEKKGLSLVNLDGNFGPFKKQEIFFAS
ncbi:MAG: NUDIX domain-containing protein [Candidatus Riflebacteria bacterium]|nr:NUDIX domain-containing protein [Candidatus Riflebacteria bacterium]